VWALPSTPERVIYTTRHLGTRWQSPWARWDVPLHEVKHVAAAPLSDGRLQLWAGVTNPLTSGPKAQLLSTWNDGTGGWTNWSDFLTDVPRGALPDQPIGAVAAAPLPDGRLQLFAVLRAGWGSGRIFTTWKTSTHPDAGWSPWSDFLQEQPSAAISQGDINAIAVAPLSDRRLQLWVVAANYWLYTTRKTTTHPNAEWSPWANFISSVPGSLGGTPNAPVADVAVVPLSDRRMQVWVVRRPGTSPYVSYVYTTRQPIPPSTASWTSWTRFDP
jgi:hypothetical protein